MALGTWELQNNTAFYTDVTSGRRYEYTLERIKSEIEDIKRDRALFATEVAYENALSTMELGLQLYTTYV